MNNTLEYKGYHTKIEYDTQDKILFGKIEGINDLVNFEAAEGENIENEFHSAVDDYLDFCMEVGKNPDKEYKGTFNVRIDPELHKKVAILALRENSSLNAVVEKSIKTYVDQNYMSSEDTSKYNVVTEKTEDVNIGIYNNNVVKNDNNVFSFPLINNGDVKEM